MTGNMVGINAVLGHKSENLSEVRKVFSAFCLI